MFELYVNVEVANVESGLITRTDTEPSACAGGVQVKEFETPRQFVAPSVTPDAANPSKVTAAPAWKFAPEIVTTGGVMPLPTFGERALIAMVVAAFVMIRFAVPVVLP